MPPTKLTKSIVENLPTPPKGGQSIHRDSVLVGFGVRLSGRTKTYFAEKRVHGRTVRVSLGRHGQMSCERARRRAQTELGRMTEGVNPNRERKAARIRGVTLREAFEEFFEVRSSLRPSTIRSYRDALRLGLSDWRELPIAEISRDMVAKRHAILGSERGEATANQTMRVLRSVLNFSQARYESRMGEPVLPRNPVDRLSETRAWFPSKRRQGHVRPDQLARWMDAVRGLGQSQTASKSQVVRDYLLVLLFTGLRRQEAARLRWQDVDLQSSILTIPETKNGEPLTLPISSIVLEILDSRRRRGVVGYVFPGAGATGHLVEPKRQIQSVREQSGVDFTLHDLRRTFVTIAESLDISAYALKRLVNHKVSGDVTAGYVVPSVERLRGPVEAISQRILELGQIRDVGAEKHA